MLWKQCGVMQKPHGSKLRRRVARFRGEARTIVGVEEANLERGAHQACPDRAGVLSSMSGTHSTYLADNRTESALPVGGDSS